MFYSLVHDKRPQTHLLIFEKCLLENGQIMT